MQKEKTKEKASLTHNILTVVGTVMCVILLPILIINLILIVKSFTNADEVPSVGGVFPLIVLTDSMYPEIESGDLYQVDSLTHSIPFLVPKASALLDSIGANFLDSLESKGLNPNQVIVTSVLRTQDDVKKLRRVNINASANSVHMFGTTFDISYKRFFKVEDPDGRPMQDVRADTLKLVLAEVLRDLKKKDMCYIKYELKQGCFHITAR